MQNDPIALAVVERLMAKIDTAGSVPEFRPDLGPCWTWRAAHVNGYARVPHRGNSRLAHRVVYELLVGAVPAGLQLDHLCRNRGCVRPSHLEAVTNAENTRRGAKGRLVTRCVRGHAYDDVNTLWRPNGRRTCRECARLHVRKMRADGYMPPSKRRAA